MKSFLIAVIFLFGATIIGIVFSSSRLPDGARSTEVSVATTTSPVIRLVSLKDSYRRRVHTVSGALVVPTPCYTVDAETKLVPSTTPQVIRLDLSVPPDTGRCLELSATTTFSVKQKAKKDAVIVTYLNGNLTATSTIP